MKEAFDTMAEHWGVTLWLGIVVMVSLHKTTYIKNNYGKNEGSNS